MLRQVLHTHVNVFYIWSQYLVLPLHAQRQVLAPGISTETSLLALDTFGPGWGWNADGRGLKECPLPLLSPGECSVLLNL